MDNETNILFVRREKDGAVTLFVDEDWAAEKDRKNKLLKLIGSNGVWRERQRAIPHLHQNCD